MLGDDYIFNPAELTSDMIDRCSHKQSKETKGTIQSPEHPNHNLNKDFDEVQIDDLNIPSEQNLSHHINALKEGKDIDN